MLLKHASGSKEVYVVSNCYPSNHAYSSWQAVFSPVLTKADGSEPSLSIYLSLFLVFVFVRVRVLQSNLDYRLTRADLLCAFSQYGHVLEVSSSSLNSDPFHTRHTPTHELVLPLMHVFWLHFFHFKIDEYVVLLDNPK